MKRVEQKATREQTRTHNARLVLKTIHDRQPISRADIARDTHLTRTTVSDVVSELMAQGLVEETGIGPSAGGKPPILLNVVDQSRHLIGIDLASEEFRGAVVNLRGAIQHRAGLPLRSRDGQAALALVYEMIDGLVAAAGSPLLGIGIGTPGLMDPVEGVVRRAVNLDWQDLPLRRLLEDRYHLPVHVSNDSQVAALAELAFGQARGARNLVVIKLEHGVGAGIVLNGQLFYGDAFGAGEIGHVVVAENGQPCRCGNFGCLETLASARAVIQQARAIAANNPGSLIHRFAATPDAVTIDAIRQAADAGDEAIRQLIVQVGRCLAIAVANLIGALSVHCVLLAGSVTCLGPALLDVVRQETTRRALGVVAGQTEIGISDIGPDIVILGASALVLTRELGLLYTLANGT